MKKIEGIPGICSSSTYLCNSQNFSDEKKYADHCTGTYIPYFKGLGMRNLEY